MTLIEAVGLQKRFGGHLAVDDVSFVIPEGGAVGLIGESGSGKSTIANMLLGLERPSGGEIFAEGARIEPWRRGSAERRNRARRMQMVFQDPYLSLNPRIPVGEAIGAVARLHGASNREADQERDRLLNAVGLGERERDALPSALSGGQRQRAAIARALAVRPKLLILDEAVAALDVSIQAQILNLLNELRAEEGVAYLFITHNLAVVQYVTEQSIVLHRGRIVERGNTAELLRDPQDPYTRALISAVPGAHQARGTRE